MAEPQLPLARVIQIAEVAQLLWQDFTEIFTHYESHSQRLFNPRYFIRENHPQIPARGGGSASQTDPERLPRNTCATAFFDFCSQRLLGAPSLVVNYRLDEGVPNLEGRATSWLWNIPHPGCAVYPVAMIDADYLAKQDGQQLPRFWTRLLLHETGHLVLHWGELDRQRESGGIPTASAVQEAEAWWFCSCITGLALASYAQSAKRNHDPNSGADVCHEDAWRYS